MSSLSHHTCKHKHPTLSRTGLLMLSALYKENTSTFKACLDKCEKLLQLQG